MNVYLNYVVEANAGLCLFMLVYWIILKQETDFKAKRFFILFALLASLLFPLIHIPASAVALPTLRDVIPTIWLPEIKINDSGTSTPATSVYAPWKMVSFVYSAGVLFFLIRFGLQLFRLLSLIRNVFQTSSLLHNLRIAESAENRPSFSFFNFIFIGQADALSIKEKQHIIAHESVHARQLHSFDILFLNVITIFFWFNPVLRIYKNIITNLHEFEADARAVKTNEVNDYCNLLARVALLSADIRIANYFNNSLTLKRIEMMRKIKSKIQYWKIAATASVIPVFFFLIACHDQVMQEVRGIAESSSMALEVPEHIQQRYEQLQQDNPDKKYILLELTGDDSRRLDELHYQYGLPSSVDVIKVEKRQDETTDVSSGDKERQGFIIVGYDKSVVDLTADLQQDGIFVFVDESATPKGGMPALYKFLTNNIKYPAQARNVDIERKVLVEFIVEPDGSLTGFKILKSVEPAIDAEVLRVMSLSPPWNPGKNNGTAIRQKLILPVSFRPPSAEGIRKKTSSLGTPLFPFQQKAEENC